MDIVFIRHMRVETLIGVHAWEKNSKQQIVIDLEMAADIARAAANDRIEDALDYEAVHRRLRQFVEASRFDLLETLAERCAAIVRNEFGVSWLRLRIDKLDVLNDVRGVGVVIERGERD